MDKQQAIAVIEGMTFDPDNKSNGRLEVDPHHFGESLLSMEKEKAVAAIKSL